jgi:choriolysin H
MSAISRDTCIRFVQRTNQADYVSIVNGDGCWSYIGRIVGKQELSLKIGDSKSSCMFESTIVHELLHAVGLHHMQKYEGRNAYVTINYENIKPGEEYNFDIVSLSKAHLFNTSYDYRRY